MDERAEKLGGSLSLGQRDEKANRPLLPTRSQARADGRGLHSRGGGWTDSKELRGIAVTEAGGAATREGGGWPLPFRRGEERGSASGGLEVEGRRAAHRYVR